MTHPAIFAASVFPSLVALAFDLRLEDGACSGLMVTSLGGVNTSWGGSYGGMGVALLLRLLKARADTVRWDDEEAVTGMGGMKSASGFDACGD